MSQLSCNTSSSSAPPLANVRLHLHKSIPHLSKRTPILRKQLEALGAKLSSSPSSTDVTHIVVTADSYVSTDSPCKSQAKLVTEIWLQQCISSKQLVPEGPYLVSQTPPNEAEPPAKKRKTTQAQAAEGAAGSDAASAQEAGPSRRKFSSVQGSAAVQDAEQIRCVTYNVLADKYARAGHTHNFCPAPLRSWSSRWVRLCAELQDHNSDIYCLQEVDEHLFRQDVQPFLTSMGCTSLFLARVYGRKASHGVVEGIVLAYQGSRFHCRTSSSFRFAERVPPGTAEGFIWKAVQAKEEGAILALLELKPSGRLLLAAATHLWYDPQWPDLKVAQTQILCQEIATFLQQHVPKRKVPVVIGGDFNSLWRKYHSDQFDQVPFGAPWMTSGVYTLLAEGCLDSSHPHHPYRRNRPTLNPLALKDLRFSTAGLKLRSSFLEAHGHEPPLTNKHAMFAGCLDYIWFTPETLSVTETLDMPYDHTGVVEPQHVRFPPIPNEVWPSDHLAVGATLQLLPELVPGEETEQTEQQ